MKRIMIEYLVILCKYYNVYDKCVQKKNNIVYEMLRQLYDIGIIENAFYLTRRSPNNEYICIKQDKTTYCYIKFKNT